MRVSSYQKSSTMVTLPSRSIHLLYVPTMGCNLGCSYCYLGKQTTDASIKKDAAKATSTLQYVLQELKQAGILAFNVSLHGGEVTTLPASVLDELFTIITQHYRTHFDALNALGHKKSAPHIKTNLYRFAPLYDLFLRHKVSISASIDLPLKLHERYRTTRAGTSWLDKTLENIRLLAQYPHAKKISATLSSEHLNDMDALIDDIWMIHRELGFDMNQLNLMFAFGSELNRAAQGEKILTPTTAIQQQALYATLKKTFMGTELEDGLQRNWFDEFKPSYCTNSINCGERFYLLQGDGSVYSCVRGQGIPEFYYGNIFETPITDILENGSRKIRTLHQKYGFDGDCQDCNHLSLCNTGCPVVKYQNHTGKSYTCNLQKQLYADNPLSYPADTPERQRDYVDYYQSVTHPQLHIVRPPISTAIQPQFIVPSDIGDAKNTLHALIAADTTLQTLFDPTLWVLEVAGETVALESQLPQLRQTPRTHYTLLRSDRVVLHLHRRVLEANSPEWLRNTVYFQLLRDTLVVYGDEQRTKQEHIFTYQLYANCLATSELLGDNYYQIDLTDLLAVHSKHYQRGVLNNLFFTTFFLRDYHYQKQKNNAFYHLQTANLPFHNFEFYYLP